MGESMHQKMMRLHSMPGHDMSEMKKATFNVALISKSEIADHTMLFTFEKPKGFTFHAGQHVRMTLVHPKYTDKEGASRFLSIASSPADKNLSFALRMRDTAFKNSLRKLQPSQKVKIQIMLEVPAGAFALDSGNTSPYVFLAGGIGIAPIYSMIKDATERDLPNTMLLIYSSKSPEDAVFLPKLINLAKQNTRLTVVPTMTALNRDTVWSGEKGRITKDLIIRLVSEPQNSTFYIAGLPAMTSVMKTIVSDLGVPSERIFAEEFEGFDLNKLTVRRNNIWPKLLIAGLLLGVILLHLGAVRQISNLSRLLSSNSSFAYIAAILAILVIGAKILLITKGLKYSLRRK